MKKIFLILAVMISVNSTLGQSKSVSERINQVEHNLIPYVPVQGFPSWTIAERMKFYNVKGLSIAVIKNYKIDWAKGYGWADTLKNQKVTPNTMFSAGSISKFVMAIGALQLVQDHKIELDLDVNTYLKSWKIKDNEWSKTKPITLRMLLSHTAGTSQTSYFGFTPEKKLPNIIEILTGDKIAESRGVVVNSEPGVGFRYSGGGSMIAQMVIMDITQQPFSSYYKTTVFDKLGMKNTTFEQPLPSKFSNVSWAYSQASWFKGMPYVYPQQAAAGLYTTPTDLAKIFKEVQKAARDKGKILTQESAKKMLTPQVNITDGGYKEQMGIGPFILQRSDNQSEKGKYFEFTGVNAGFLAYGIASFEDGNGVIIMLNSGDNVNGLGKEIRRSVAKTYHWTNYLPDEIIPIHDNKIDFKGMEGRYRSGPDEVISMKMEKNYLVEQFNNGVPIYCFPVAKDTIVFSDYNIKGFFGRDADGAINSLRNMYQEKPMPKMTDNEFTPSEYLKAKNYQEAKKGFAAMKMNEYQITYLIYELLNQKNTDFVGVKTILEVATEQHSASSIVNSRWGDYYLKLKDYPNALRYYKTALTLDPNNEELMTTITKLSQ